MPVASAGARDRLVRVEWRPAADDVETSGFPTDDWVTFRDVYMARTIAQAKETFQSDQTSAASTARWECEYLVEMDPDLIDVPKRFRLQYGGRAYDILSAEVLGRLRGLAFTTLAPSGVA